MIGAAHPPLYRAPRRRRVDPGLLIVVGLFAAVLIAGAALTALAVATIPDIAAIYVPTP
jgi:hypothetical protein